MLWLHMRLLLLLLLLLLHLLLNLDPLLLLLWLLPPSISQLTHTIMGTRTRTHTHAQTWTRPCTHTLALLPSICRGHCWAGLKSTCLKRGGELRGARYARPATPHACITGASATPCCCRCRCCCCLGEVGIKGCVRCQIFSIALSLPGPCCCCCCCLRCMSAVLRGRGRRRGGCSV